MGYIAVLDTETNWYDAVMSIGLVIARDDNYSLIASRYYIIDPEYKVGGMFSDVIVPKRGQAYKVCSRNEAIADIVQTCVDMGVSKLFAYNAPFDFRHLPELSSFDWYDIMKIAAYRQYNPFIPGNACCCNTGRLKSNYNVEAMTRLLTGNCTYAETHNALEDATDELNIMRLLGKNIRTYDIARI